MRTRLLASSVATVAVAILTGSLMYSQSDLRSIHKVFIEKMPNDLDQYLRAEFFKQLKGKVTVVLKREDADGIITGINEEQKGTAAKITGRYLGLHDTVNGTISLLDKTETDILWSDEAGDRNLIFGVLHRGGERKVADRLVGKLKKAMGTDASAVPIAPRASNARESSFLGRLAGEGSRAGSQQPTTPFETLEPNRGVQHYEPHRNAHVPGKRPAHGAV